MSSVSLRKYIDMLFTLAAEVIGTLKGHSALVTSRILLLEN